MSDIFISHSSKNKQTADALVAALEKEGLPCWIAPRNIPTGSNYGAAIAKGIRECKVLLLVFSEDSNNSDAVFREVQMAFDEKKEIIPVRIEKIPASDNLSFFLSSLQWFDVSPNEKNFDDLIPDIRKACDRYHDEQDNPNPVAKRSHKPAKKMATSTKNALITASSIVLCSILVLAAVLIITRQERFITSVFLTMDATAIRVDADQDNIVQDIVPLYDVDERLLDGFVYDGLALDQAVSGLIYRAFDIGIIDEGTVIAISIDAPNMEAFVSVSEVLVDVIADLSDALDVVFDVRVEEQPETPAPGPPFEPPPLVLPPLPPWDPSPPDDEYEPPPDYNIYEYEP